MQLVITSFGSYLQKEGDCFKVKKGDEQFEISSKKVSSILISTSAYITTDAIKMAMDNNIDIVLLDKFGEPFSRVWHCKIGSTTLIRRRQIEIADKDEGIKEIYKCPVYRGYICYVRSGSHPIEIVYEEKDYKHAVEVVDEIFKIIEKGYYPKATKWKNRCIDCCYRNICV